MPSPPAPAATVILLRDGLRGPEVLLLERSRKSGFLPDMYVFPGGRVEPGDRTWLEDTRLPGVDQADQRLPMVDPAWAPGYLAAAIRETFEESGILLARSPGSGAPADPARVRELGPRRLDVQAGQHDFGVLLRDAGLQPDLDALAVHAHWITPESVPRRFDTVFFSALAPEGQRALHDGVEVTHHVWIRPEDALAQAREGTRQIIFPTACNLETLCGFERASDVWQASEARRVVTVLPRVEEREGRATLVIPEDAGYTLQRQSMPDSLR